MKSLTMAIGCSILALLFTSCMEDQPLELADISSEASLMEVSPPPPTDCAGSWTSTSITPTLIYNSGCIYSTSSTAPYIFANPIGSAGLLYSLDNNYYYHVDFEMRKVGASGGGGFAGFGAPPTWTSFSSGVLQTSTTLYGGGSSNGGVEIRNISWKRKLKVSTPTLSSVSKSGDNELTLTWTNVANECGYEIYRSINGGSYYKVDEVGQDVTTWKNSNISGHVPHSYYVRAYTDLGLSGLSNAISATPKGYFEFTPTYVTDDGDDPITYSGGTFTLESPSTLSSGQYISDGEFTLTGSDNGKYAVSMTYDYDAEPTDEDDYEVSVNIDFSPNITTSDYPSYSANHLELYSNHTDKNEIDESYNSGNQVNTFTKAHNFPWSAVHYYNVTRIHVHAWSQYSNQKSTLELTNLKIKRYKN